MTEQTQSPRDAVANQPATPGLAGRLSTFEIVFTVLAFNAPLSVFVGFLPVVIGYGNQLGAPATFIATGSLLLLFSVGYTAMARRFKNPGGFYAYVSAGLGKPLGLGAAGVALLTYLFLLTGSYAYGGLTFQALVQDVFGGPALPWWMYSVILLGIVAVLGYFNISLSAKVLTVTMILEVLVIVVFDAVVIFGGGDSGLTTAPFLAEHILSGSIGLAILFGIISMGGFEATAIFREEARNPERTIPRATYIAVAMLSSMYAVTSYALIVGIGPGNVVEATAGDPTTTTLGTIGRYLGVVTQDVVTVLLCTSVFAALVAIHNVSARYLYSLSVDRVLPAAVGMAHPRHGSPYRASMVASGVTLALMVVLSCLGVGPATLYANLVGIGGYGFLLLMFLTSLAVIRYFRTNPQFELGPWRSVIAPILAAVGLLSGIVLASVNIETLIGGSSALAAGLLVLFYGSIAGGAVFALRLRRSRPDVYARIGREGS